MAAPHISALPTAPSRSDPPATFVARADAFVAALAQFRSDANTQADYLDEAADNAATVLESAGFSGSSTTSLAIGTGSKTLTTQAGRGFAPSAFIVVASASDLTGKQMVGQVSAYNTTTGVLMFTVTDTRGSGTFTDWVIALSGPQGQQGDARPAPIRKTADFTAVVGNRYECDTSGGSFTCTFPASPSEGDWFELCDVLTPSYGGWAVNSLNVNRNGSTVCGSSDSTMLFNAPANVLVEYSNGTWVLK